MSACLDIIAAAPGVPAATPRIAGDCRVTCAVYSPSTILLTREKQVTSISGGGGLYSTAVDYLTLIRMLLQGGQLNGVRLLREETVALMSRNQIGDLEAGVLKTTNRVLSDDVDFFPHIRLRWSLGHMINMDPVPHGRSAGSLTWAGLFNTYYWIDPVKRVAAVFMTQVLPFADRLVLSLYGQFERGIYSAVNAE